MSTQPAAHIHDYSARRLRSTRHYMMLWWLLAAILVPNIGLLFRPIFGLYGWVFYGLVYQSTLYIPALIASGMILWIFPPGYRHLWSELRTPFGIFWAMILLETLLPTDTIDGQNQYFPLVGWLMNLGVPHAWVWCATIVGTLALIAYAYILVLGIRARRASKSPTPGAASTSTSYPRPTRSRRHTMMLAWISTAVIGYYLVALAHIRVRALLGADLGFTLVLPPMGVAVVPTLALLGMVLLAFPKTGPVRRRIWAPFSIFWAMAFTIIWFVGDYFTDWWRIPTFMTIVSHTGRAFVRPLALAMASPLLLIALISLVSIGVMGYRTRRRTSTNVTITPTNEPATSANNGERQPATRCAGSSTIPVSSAPADSAAGTKCTTRPRQTALQPPQQRDG
jgi:hypothetical protein